MTFSAQQAGDLLARLREARPLVHNITNAVAMDISANVLLAIGASPAMVMAPEEVEDFAAIAGSLVVNIGTLSTQSVSAMRLAATAMQRQGKPWVVDPVGCGATPFRTASAGGLAALRPTAIRGNPGEIAALAGATGVTTRGVDSVLSPEQVLDDAVGLALSTGAVVAMTGVTDYVTDGHRTLAFDGGDALMPYVTGLGCSLSATVAAFLATGEEPFACTAAAMASFALAGIMAADVAYGPGSFRMRFLDALFQLKPSDLAAHARIRAV